MMYQQNRLLEALVTTITAQAQGNQGNPRPVAHHNGNGSIIADFHRLQPPKFGGSDNPIEADDWLREIEMKLEVVHADDRDKVLLAVHQLRGQALAWWQSYREVNEDAVVMGWANFVKIFREQHIASIMMKLKKDEFRKLRQGAMSVSEYLHKFTELSHYAPEDVNDDEKKQEAFLSGLNSEIRTLVEVTVHNDFNAMVNRAITTERNKKAEFNERKRRFESKRPQQPEKFQRTQFPAHIGHQSQGAMPPKAHPSSFQKPAQSAPLQKTQSTFRTQQTGGGIQVTNMRACFHYREIGHLIANCP
jgi:hypothetical protein